MPRPLAIVVGVGDGLSASLARALAPTHALILAARNVDKLALLAAETDATTAPLDATDPKATAALFKGLSQPPRVVVYNPSFRTRGPLIDLETDQVRRALEITAFGAFLTGQAAARAMLAAEPVDGVRGTILFTGASAGVKGFARSAPFAMGKFAQRGLAESMARELHPQGIHVVWINIDGAIRNPGVDPGEPDSKLDPDAIAGEYLRLAAQPRSVWSHEATLRPWSERF
jgi:NAD(P)-dependent dehydrogenase (short-subunit alcohol dehydrogenase family)